MADNQQRCELKLIASPGSWRLYSARKIDERFKSYEQKIFQRDRYTCQFCGFQARLYQDIVNLDGDYTTIGCQIWLQPVAFVRNAFLLSQ